MRDKPDSVKLPIPSHLCEVLKPIGQDNCEHLVMGNLRCPCGDKLFSVRSDEALNRVRLNCVACGREVMMFDASKHGWDGFVCQMAVEEAPEADVICNECGQGHFGITVSIHSQGREDFIQESGLNDSTGRTLSRDDWVDAFEWIVADLECDACGVKQIGWLDRETM